MTSSASLRLLWSVVFLIIRIYNGSASAAESLGFYCTLQPCAMELYLNCPHGLQRDHMGCDVCACRPAPEQVCSGAVCSVLCNYLPHRLYLCPSCICPGLQHSEPKRFICPGGLPEHVDAALTGQIGVISSNIVQRNQQFCNQAPWSRWRTVDGTCNNVRNYGATFGPVARVLPPAYEDGQQAPRTSGVYGSPLPSGRLVSRVVHVDRDRPGQFTAMFMQFGQFLDHDITSFPLPTDENKTIQCCTEDGRRKSPPPHRDCFPIDVSGDSHFYPRTCMEFIRSVPIIDKQGNVLLQRENVNAVTSFVDGSAIYGSSEERMRELRSNNGTGMYLRSSPGGFLPLDCRDSCIRRQTSDPCYLAGDERVNEQPGLTALHTVFFRQHNRIAATLHRLLPQEKEEEIFQRSRAVMGAVLQNIVYGGWLPLVLGPVYMHRYGLKTGTLVAYNPDIDPRIGSVFSTAVFRFGHSMIPPSLSVGGEQLPLHLLFNKPFLVQEKFPQLVHGLINCTGTDGGGGRAQTVDRHFVEAITNRLFQPLQQPSRALDLVALNIQRGRDHGLPSFTQFRRECGLGLVTSFHHPALGTAGPLLQQVYRDVRDIDVFTGGMVEPAEDGAIVGPTFACLMARQFHSLKYGDRFYFEASHGPSGFTERQVKELRKATLGWILCNNLPFQEVQEDVFRKTGPGNPTVTCSEMLSRGPDLRVLANIGISETP